MYFGYSQKLQKVFGYVKYAYSDSKFDLTDIIHNYASIFYINVGGASIFKNQNLNEFEG